MIASRQLNDFVDQHYNRYQWDYIFKNFYHFIYYINDTYYLKRNFPDTYKNFYQNINDEIGVGKNGYLSFDKEKQQIKFGKILSSLNQDTTKRKLNDSEVGIIEKIVNSYKAWQNKLNKEYKFIELKGRYIVTKGYNTRYYYKRCGTLSDSCMNNKRHLLGLYKRNKEKISLITLQDKFGKIHARALVWKLDRPFNTIFMDRVYYILDHQVDILHKYAKEKGWLYKGSIYGSGIINKEYTEFNNKDLFQVKLNTWGTIFHPYMDTMKYRTGLDSIFTNNKIFYTKWNMDRTDGLLSIV